MASTTSSRSMFFFGRGGEFSKCQYSINNVVKFSSANVANCAVSSTYVACRWHYCTYCITNNWYGLITFPNRPAAPFSLLPSSFFLLSSPIFILYYLFAFFTLPFPFSLLPLLFLLPFHQRHQRNVENRPLSGFCYSESNK